MTTQRRAPYADHRSQLPRPAYEAKAEWAREVERIRINARLKDEFGARFVRVRGAIKVKCHLMFGLVALTVDQILRVTKFRPALT
jgi:hypothetical protein